MSNETAKVIRFPIERREAVPLVSLRGLIERFGYSERWWRYRTAEEGFPVRRWGGRLRFDPAEVERWLDTRYKRGA